MSVDNSFVPQQRIIAPAIRLRRERLLESPGKVFAQKGQSVRPNDVIARGTGQRNLTAVNVGKKLELDAKGARNAIQVSVGESVNTDTVLAETRKLLRRRRLHAPINGRVAHIDTNGIILLETHNEEEILRAGFHGRIIEVMARFGAVVEATGALVQGVWGNGAQNIGVLRVLTPSTDTSLSSELFDAGLRGALVVAGKTIDRDVFEAAASAKVRGLIVGSLHPELIELARQYRDSYAVIVTDGVNRESMAQPIFDILQQNEGREARIDARFQLGRDRLVPEIFIGKSIETAPEVDERAPLREGDMVCVVAPPYLGRVGIVKTIDAGRHLLDSGLEVAGCTVEFSSGDAQFVPTTNLERFTGYNATEM